MGGMKKKGEKMKLFPSLYLVTLFLIGFSSLAVAYLQAKPPKKHAQKEEVQTTTARAFYAKLSGNWKGPYSLWLRPGTPAQKSNISAHFQPTAKGNYFLMTYSWKQGGKVQEGVFLFGGHEKAATATWGDSFHMVPTPMQCKGVLKNGGKKLVITGSYSVGKGPAWNWRTEFTQQGPNSLLMEAYNIMPNGVEGLAVKAELKRVIKDEK